MTKAKKRHQSNQRRITTLIQALAGQAQILTIPRLFLTLTGGDLPAALLLSQCIYWSDRGVLPGEWFYKSYEDWEEEIGLSKYQTGRAAGKLKKLGYLETAVRKAPPSGAPTVHYRPLLDAVSEAIGAQLDSEGSTLSIVDLPGPNNGQVTKRSKSKQTARSLTDSTPETTQENTKEEPPATTRQITDAYINLLEYDPKEWANGEGAAAKYIAERWSVDQMERAYSHYKADRFWSDQRLRLRNLKERIPEYLRSLGEPWASSMNAANIDPDTGAAVNESLQLQIGILQGAKI